MKLITQYSGDHYLSNFKKNENFYFNSRIMAQFMELARVIPILEQFLKEKLLKWDTALRTLHEMKVSGMETKFAHTF